MATDDFPLRNLARAFLAGPWSRAGLLHRGAQACGERTRSLQVVVRRVLAAFPTSSTQPDEEELIAFLTHGNAQCYDYTPRNIFWALPRMAPPTWLPPDADLPSLPTTTAVAEWLSVSLGELDWFADYPRRKRNRHIGPLNHYIYRFLSKPSGKKRLLEVPHSRLKGIQRRILHGILDHLPSHEAAHGYRPGRSVLSYAAPHAGRDFVMRFDLRDFFPSIQASRVHAVFRGAGYPREVARALTRLCTNVVSLHIEEAHRAAGIDWRRYREPHLPQGSPTSPALANLCAYRLDCRLAGLARSLGGRYTRYADDLAFSGGEEMRRNARRLHVLVARIALEERFEVNTRKTRFMGRGGQQHLCGLVVNVKPNIRRAEFDQLKAILCNCVRHGPAGQNREGVPDFRAHLLGRISYFARVNPARGERLSEMFDQIAWPI